MKIKIFLLLLLFPLFTIAQNVIVNDNKEDVFIAPLGGYEPIFIKSGDSAILNKQINIACITRLYYSDVIDSFSFIKREGWFDISGGFCSVFSSVPVMVRNNHKTDIAIDYGKYRVFVSPGKIVALPEVDLRLNKDGISETGFYIARYNGVDFEEPQSSLLFFLKEKIGNKYVLVADL